MARDGKVRSLEGQVTVAAGQIREREALLERQRQRAAELERSGSKIGDKLLKDIATTEAQIARNQARIEALRAEQAQIRATYDADIARYRELKGLPPKQPVPEMKKP
jgi:chromosome segregation ATPase